MGIIDAENRRPGSGDWLLTRVQPAPPPAAADPFPEHSQFQRRPAIEGYCSHASACAGQTLSVHVSTDPPSPFRCDVYRLGYYNGAGARRVASIGPLPGATQPTPADGPNRLIECRWPAAFTLAITDDWVSGVYLGKLTAETSGYQAYVVFIVRDGRDADLLFQCSDLTWQAYNRWPAWRSLYDWNGNNWHTQPGADVGFDRPYSFYYNLLPSGLNEQTNGSGEFTLWEFPLAFWLEKHGYDVTYISNLDTHNDRAGLLRAKGFLSVGHDEYWTRRMYDNVCAARDAGLNLAFLSGNSVSGEIYLHPSSDGHPDRVFGRIRHFRGDDAALMGAASHGVGLGPWTCVAPDHWLFGGTGMKAGDAIAHLVGWEYHGPPLGQQPGLTVLATGKLPRPEREVTYAATVYEARRGNFVFNAATCWWNMVLSKPPGFRNPPRVDFSREDQRVQRMTQNVVERMIASERPVR